MFGLIDKLVFGRLSLVHYDGRTYSQIFGEEISSYVKENVDPWFYWFFSLCLSDHYIKRILDSLNELVSTLLQEFTNV